MKGACRYQMSMARCEGDIVPFANLYDLLVLGTKDKGYDVVVVRSKEREVVKKKKESR